MSPFRYRLNQAAAPVLAGTFLGGVEGACLLGTIGAYLGAMIGFIVSLLLLPFALICTSDKDPFYCALWLGGVPFVPLLFAIMWTSSIWVPMMVAIAIYICVLIGIWQFMPITYHAPGHCNKCGYDLTGNVSGTCPECGMIVKADIK